MRAFLACSSLAPVASRPYWSTQVKVLTAYAFSTENWKRSKIEVDTLMGLFTLYLDEIEKQSALPVRRVARVLGSRACYFGDRARKR